MGLPKEASGYIGPSATVASELAMCCVREHKRLKPVNYAKYVIFLQNLICHIWGSFATYFLGKKGGSKHFFQKKGSYAAFYTSQGCFRIFLKRAFWGHTGTSLLTRGT